MNNFSYRLARWSKQKTTKKYVKQRDVDELTFSVYFLRVLTVKKIFSKARAILCKYLRRYQGIIFDFHEKKTIFR